MNRYLEEINENKYLTLAPANESKERKKKVCGTWIKIRDLIRSIAKNSDDFDEKYVKTKFDSDDNLPLNKTEIPILTIAVTAVFRENKKYYPQVCLDECLYKI